jgi:hypothetical protein
MFYLFLIGIFFLTQQGIKGALNLPHVPEPEITPYVPSEEELAQAKKELEVLAGLWVRYSQTAHHEDTKRTKGFFSFSKKKKKPTKNDLWLLQVACQYKKLREKYPELPENEAIQFFIDNSTVNGRIKDFQFNNPDSPATVTRESDGAYHAAVDWRGYYPVYVEKITIDPQTGIATVLYDKGLDTGEKSKSRRGRSNTSPAPVKPVRRPNRAERGLSLPTHPAGYKPFKELPKAESGYVSQQSVAHSPTGTKSIFFAEV